MLQLNCVLRSVSEVFLLVHCSLFTLFYYHLHHHMHHLLYHLLRHHATPSTTQLLLHHPLHIPATPAPIVTHAYACSRLPTLQCHAYSTTDICALPPSSFPREGTQISKQHCTNSSWL